MCTYNIDESGILTVLLRRSLSATRLVLNSRVLELTDEPGYTVSTLLAGSLKVFLEGSGVLNR